jgi:hypothetical protein
MLGQGNDIHIALYDQEARKLFALFAGMIDAIKHLALMEDLGFWGV